MPILYSKAKIAGHPVHPMLVAFPVTLYVVTCVSFIVYAVTDDTFWFRVGTLSNLAGVVMALIAAVPGFIDWAFGVPSGSKAKAVGLAHLLLNLCALVILGVNAFVQWTRLPLALPPSGLPVVLSSLGVLLTGVAGYLGWSLVQIYHVGVDLTREQQRFEPRGPGSPGAGAGLRTLP